MFCHDTSVAVEQSCHCFLSSPDVLVLVEHLYTLFLVFCLENQELCRTVSYLVFLCHISLHSYAKVSIYGIYANKCGNH